MAEVLSQSEIDALLAAVSAGAVETAQINGGDGEKKPGDWIAYDLTSQEKIVKGKLVALQGIHERFARLFRITLSNSLKKNVTVTCTNIDFLRFSDYIANILLPTSLNILSMQNLKGHMLFVMSSKLTYAMVDAYYGGSERPFSKIGGREEFTVIETNMLKRITQMAVKDLKEAWKLNYPVELEYVRSESNPHFVGSIHSSELVAVISFDIEFENLSGPFVVIVQLRALDPIQQFLAVNVTGEVSADQPAWREHWMNELAFLELDMHAELGFSFRTLRQIQDLKVGDELLLSQDAATPLVVTIEDMPKIKGMMGTIRGNTAIRVTELLQSQKG